MVVADSGSSDGTAEEAEAAGASLVRAPPGKWAAILTAVREFPSEAYLMVDVDLPVDCWDISRVLRTLKEADLVVVRRAPDLRPLPDRVLTRAFRLISLALGVPFPDVQAGVKAFRRDVVTQLGPLLPPDLLGDLVLVYIALQNGFTVREVPVTWRDSRSWSGRLRLSTRILRELLLKLPFLLRMRLQL